jgi:chromosome segregation ATPase
MIGKRISKLLRSKSATLALHESRQSVEQAEENLTRITARAEKLDPKLERLRDNAERNHVVANILSTFRVVNNGGS